MALIRWEPFREIDSLQREMNRLFDTLATRTDAGSMTTGLVLCPLLKCMKRPRRLN